VRQLTLLCSVCQNGRSHRGEVCLSLAFPASPPPLSRILWFSLLCFSFLTQVRFFILVSYTPFCYPFPPFSFWYVLHCTDFHFSHVVSNRSCRVQKLCKKFLIVPISPIHSSLSAALLDRTFLIQNNMYTI